METKIIDDQKSLATSAARQAAQSINRAIAERGIARIIAATGASQFAFLGELTRDSSIDWSRVEMFHLDEYIGLPDSHPASFRRYLLDRLILKTTLNTYHLLDAELDPIDTIRRVSAALSSTDRCGIRGNR
jgi:glucosamine-6-phosphate deaminase